VARGMKFHKVTGGLTLASVAKRILGDENVKIHVDGGRKEGLALLKRLPDAYHQTHDIPSVPTSNLSAHHHFGTISIRETLAAAKSMPAAARQAFIRQLFWRDFYGNIMADFHGLYGMEATEFQSKGWTLSAKKRKLFEDWKAGTTGKEMVDAGMRQLNTSGYMHNRMRLICSSYLVKDCGVHWRLGERYFADKLVDYDITQNMMNWIWVASELPFASAPFRRHDPEVGAERFNEDRSYRNLWLDK
jgi:deoxyribodipyrimidine photo-lyase